jgi:hypothetical protein
MHENLRRSGENVDTSVRLGVVSRDLETCMTISDHTLRVQSKDGDIGYLLDPQEALFARCLVEYPNRPFLASEIIALKPSLFGVKLANVYKGFTGKLGPNQSRDNFIAYGHGRSKKYGLLTNSKDPDKLLEYDRRSIKSSKYSDRRKNKQLRICDEVEAYYDESQERSYYSRRILGATALTTTITIGGTMIWIYRKSHSE